jgi:phosphate uptake regulator
MWKELTNIWRANDLSKQAWDQCCEMLELSRNIFSQSIIYLREAQDIETLKKLKKRDKEINEFQQEVRRKVLTHYSIQSEKVDIANGLILINTVVDIERIGDYCKNILDLAINHPTQIISEEISEDLAKIENEVQSRFDKTCEAINKQDTNIAKDMMKDYREQLAGKSDEIVNNVLNGQLDFGSSSKTAAVTLYARYLKRIGAHLKNITTTLVNPFDSIGYKK